MLLFAKEKERAREKERKREGEREREKEREREREKREKSDCRIKKNKITKNIKEKKKFLLHARNICVIGAKYISIVE